MIINGLHAKTGHRAYSWISGKRVTWCHLGLSYASTYMGPIVIDLLPAFLDDPLLFLDPRQQAVAALADFEHGLLVGQPCLAALFFLAPALFFDSGFPDAHTPTQYRSLHQMKRWPLPHP